MNRAQFLANTERAGADVAALAEAAGIVGPFDFSYESLDRLEAVLRHAALASPDAPPDRVEALATRYCGDVLIKHTGAAWGVRKDPDSGRTLPCLRRLPGWSNRALFLRVPVRWAWKAPNAGALRVELERCDFAHRRRWSDDLLARLDAEIAALEGEVARVSPGWTADKSAQSVQGLQLFLRDLAAVDALDERRAGATRAALYLGEIARVSLVVDWSLCEDPVDGARGNIVVDWYSPFDVVRAFMKRPTEVDLVASLPEGA